jgi:predicted transposase/invertase (TIGR01784 family)
VFHIREKDSGLIYFKDLELHTIELNKFTHDSKDELSDIVAKVKNSLDMWVAFLTRNDLLDKQNLPKELDDPSLKKALNVLEVMNFGPEERDFYEDHLKWLRIEANTLKKIREEGREEGKEIGEAIGKEAKSIEIAKKMLAKNRSIDEIIEFTELSLEQIEKLK